MSSVASVAGEEAERLIAGGARLLDVRSPGEHEQLGHIPGSWLLPVDLIASAPGLLRDRARPVLVYCEHGVRSRLAAEFLVRAGFAAVHDLAGGLSQWRGAREHGPGLLRGPCSWLLEGADLLPSAGRVLDVACGYGRHALLLAGAGYEVEALDRDRAALAFVAETATALGLRVATREVDLEGQAPDLGAQAFDVVLVVHYLHRPLFPALVRALSPGGLLVYETFTRAQAQISKPTNPAFLLDPGELPGLCAGLEIVRQREGQFEGRHVAAVAARRLG